MKSNWKYLVVGAVVAAALTVSASEAKACWGWGACYPTACYSSCCYTPCCYTAYCYPTVSYCDPCCGSWYLGYRRGPIRRAFLGRYRWYWGGWGCCYSCGCDPCCCTSVSYCDTMVGACDAAGTIVEPSTSDKPTPAPAQPAPEPNSSSPAPGSVELPGGSTSVPTRANSGLLTIWVPYSAKVYINDHETTTTGSRRRYVSHGLKPGLTYKYVIRAELVREGKLYEQTKTVHLTAGATEGVAFGFNPLPTAGLAAAR